MHGHNAAEKVTLTSTSDNLDQIVIQLLAVFCFPIIIPLIHRNDKSLVRTLHIGNKFCFRTFHRLYRFFCVNRFDVFVEKILTFIPFGSIPAPWSALKRKNA